MSDNISDSKGSKIKYLLVGLGIGSLVAALFAPKSGEETRDFLSLKARELRESAEDLIDFGKKSVVREKSNLSAAIQAGKDVYRQERSKTAVAS